MEGKRMDEESTDPVIRGQPMNVRLDDPCIVCGMRMVENTVVNLQLPHLGAAMQTTYVCRNCGYRHADMIMLENRGALRYVAFVERESDLSMKVIRSNSGTIRIPELGVDIEPGMASESFITNAEGVLDRIEEVVSALRTEEEVTEKCDRLLERIDRMRRSSEPFHIIVEDPYGNSAILGENVRMDRLSDEEARRLQAGELVFDLRSAEGTQDVEGSGKAI